MRSLTIFLGIIFSFSSISCEKSSSLQFKAEISEIDKEYGIIHLTSQLINNTEENLQIFKPIKGYTVADRVEKYDGTDFSYRISITPEFRPGLYFILKPGESYSWTYSIEEQTTGIPEAGGDPFKFQESKTYNIQLFYWSNERLHPSNYFQELDQKTSFFEGNIESNVIRLEY